MLVQWAVLSFAFWVTAKIVPGFRLSGVWNSIVVAAIFGILNFLLGWLLYYGIGILTLGIGLVWVFKFVTHWIVNAILLKLTDALTSRFDVKSFGTAMLGALVMSFLGQLGLYLLQRMHYSAPGSVFL